MFHCKTVPKAFCQVDFCEFLEELDEIEAPRPLQLVLDNLRVHHTKAVKKVANDLGFILIFNAPYSSEFNASEMVWAISKRSFRRQFCALNCKKIQQSKVDRLVI